MNMWRKIREKAQSQGVQSQGAQGRSMQRQRADGEQAGKGSRALGIGMAFIVLAAAFYFSGEDFWEQASGKAREENSRLVIIDAGHGGSDPGKIGVDGVKEKDLNLVMAKKLGTLLLQQDLEVLYLRESDAGLYDESASNKKVQDMKRRCDIINEEKPALVISIHQNSYHEESIHGAQVFYYATSSESERLAKVLQSELVRVVEPENHRQAKANDTYYLLKKTEAPVVIVECGFLSNWEECAKLQDENYQDRVVWAVHMGVLKYLNAD